MRARSAQAELPRAGRPGAPALVGEHPLRDRDLLGLAGLVGVARTAVGAPGRRRELQATGEAVSGVDVPVAAALALRELVPGRARGRVRGPGDGEGDADRN